MPFTANDYEKLHQLMNSSPEIRELLQKLLDSQQYTISKISHEVRNPLTLIYSTFQLIESSHPDQRFQPLVRASRRHRIHNLSAAGAVCL